MQHVIFNPNVFLPPVAIKNTLLKDNGIFKTAVEDAKQRMRVGVGLGNDLDLFLIKCASYQTCKACGEEATCFSY